MQLDPYETVTRRLHETTGYHPPGDRGDWRCPAHDDTTASLSVNHGAKGVVLHCHAGCEPTAILEALGLSAADLFDSNTNGAVGGDRRRVVATYDYVDEAGQLLFQVLRYQPKEFRQRVPDGNGGWNWSLTGTRRVIYRLPRVIEAARQGRRIWVVEGEKDVHALEAAGEVATCNAGGASASHTASKWRPEYNDAFKGARVTVVADGDAPGRNHANQIAAALIPVAKTVRLVEPKLGKDAAEHLGAGFGLDDFVGDPEPRPALEFWTAAEHAARVDAAPPVGWLARPVWPADAYGVLAAQQKAGKTWAALDLVVAAASGGAWFGMFPVGNPGAVVVCLGEGGERKMLRRLRSICDLYGEAYESLPIHLCFRVPHLSDNAHLGLLDERCAQVQPVLVVIDPLYLAARGAKSSQLYEMGEHLERVQLLVQTYRAALVIVHHWNKTGVGVGADRMTGVGGQEWGRVLISASVLAKTTDPDTKASKVVLDFEVVGDELADDGFRIRRTVTSDDSDDLNAALHYEVDILERDDIPDQRGDEMRPAARRVIAVLETATDWLSVREIGDRLAADDNGQPLKRGTIQKACRDLKEAGLVQPYGVGAGGEPYSWRAVNAFDQWGQPAFPREEGPQP